MGDPSSPRSGVHKVDIFVGACAVLISAVSLFIGYRSNVTQERLLAASVWPYLSWNDSNFDEKRQVQDIYLALDNAGVGPAKVKWLAISYDGKPLKTGTDLVKACCKEELAPLQHWNISTGSINPAVIPAHDSNQFFSMERKADNAALWDKLNHERFKLRAQACYCSVLDDCWLLDTELREPKPVANCAAPPADQYQ